MTVKKDWRSSRQLPDDKTQVNFNIKKTSLEKVKIIAIKEDSNNSEVLNTAVDEYIDRYEAREGKIKPPQKGGGLKTGK